MDIRMEIINNLKLAIQKGARQEKACEVMGISLRTLKRWQKNKLGDGRKIKEKKPANKLEQWERDRIIEVSCSAEFMNMSPNEIVPILAERSEYIASESTFYRVLKAEGLLKHRGETKAAVKRKKPDELKATGPDQVYSWDITYLRTEIKGMFYYLYMFMDVWSRSIVGWKIHEVESGELASNTFRDICRERNVRDIYLHSDNGGPMKSANMLSVMQILGVTFR